MAASSLPHHAWSAALWKTKLSVETLDVLVRHNASCRKQTYPFKHQWMLWDTPDRVGHQWVVLDTNGSCEAPVGRIRH